MNHEPSSMLRSSPSSNFTIHSYVPSLPGSIVLSSKSSSVLYEYVIPKFIDDDNAPTENTYECRGQLTPIGANIPLLVIASVQCHVYPWESSGNPAMAAYKQLKILYVETMDAARHRGWCLDPNWYR